MSVFVMALLLITQNWKHPNGLQPVHKETLVHPYSGMLFTKQKERTTSNTRCRILKCIVLSERNWTQKSIYCIFYLYDPWVRVQELTTEECWGHVSGGDRHVLYFYILICMVLTRLYAFLKTCLTLKKGNFTAWNYTLV